MPRINTPFATSGDKEDPDGPISNPDLSRATGWGVQYSTPSSGRHPEREVFNNELNLCEESIKEIQDQGISPWYSGNSYPVRSMVYRSGNIWQTNISGDTSEPGVGASWHKLEVDKVARLDGATFTGDVNVATQSVADNSTKAANTAHVKSYVVDKFNSSSTVFGGQLPSGLPLTDNSQKPVYSNWVKSQNYATTTSLQSSVDENFKGLILPGGVNDLSSWGADQIKTTGTMAMALVSPDHGVPGLSSEIALRSVNFHYNYSNGLSDGWQLEHQTGLINGTIRWRGISSGNVASGSFTPYRYALHAEEYHTPIPAGVNLVRSDNFASFANNADLASRAYVDDRVSYLEGLINNYLRVGSIILNQAGEPFLAPPGVWNKMAGFIRPDPSGGFFYEAYRRSS